MRFYIKVRNKLGVEPKMIHNELKLFDSVHAPSLKTINNWIKDFNNNRESLEDKPRSGRPISESTPQNIELVRNVIERIHISITKKFKLKHSLVMVQFKQ